MSSTIESDQGGRGGRKGQNGRGGRKGQSDGGGERQGGERQGGERQGGERQGGNSRGEGGGNSRGKGGGNSRGKGGGKGVIKARIPNALMSPKAYAFLYAAGLSDEQEALLLELVTRRAGLLNGVTARGHHAYVFVRVTPITFDSSIAELLRAIKALEDAKLDGIGVGWEACTRELFATEGCKMGAACTALHLPEISQVDGRLQKLAQIFKGVFEGQQVYADNLYAANPDDRTVSYPKGSYGECCNHLKQMIEMYGEAAALEPVARTPLVIQSGDLWNFIMSTAHDVLIVPGAVIEDQPCVERALNAALHYCLTNLITDLTARQIGEFLEVWKTTVSHGSETGKYPSFIAYRCPYNEVNLQEMKVQFKTHCRLAEERRDKAKHFREASAVSAAEAAEAAETADCGDWVVPDPLRIAADDFFELEWRLNSDTSPAGKDKLP